MLGIRSFFLRHLCSVFKSAFCERILTHVEQQQEYGTLLVSFRMISVLQSSLQRNASLDFGLRVDYQG